MKLSCSPIEVGPGVTLYHTGPSLEQGPLPSFFYFSLSGPDSLTVPPYNQPVQFLQDQNIRVFSLTLPAHEEGLLPTDAMNVWANWIEQGSDFLDRFFEKAKLATDFAVENLLADPDRMAVGGLSRGAFIASHLAARDERFRFLLGFAPLTRLEKIKEFEHRGLASRAGKYDLSHLVEALEKKRVRFYIGNLDTRVSTRSCFEFIMALSELKKPKALDAELFISKSIGQMGHGTSPEIFKQGAQWIAENL